MLLLLSEVMINQNVIDNKRINITSEAMLYHMITPKNCLSVNDTLSS